MNRALRLLILGLLLGPTARASSPEELFFESARLAGEAELAASRADWATAVVRWENAVVTLESLRAEHPAWNPPVVELRLRTYRQQWKEVAKAAGITRDLIGRGDAGMEPTPTLQQLRATNLSLQSELEIVRAELQRTEATNAWLAAQLVNLNATNTLLSAFSAEVTAELHTVRQRVEQLEKELAQAQAAARGAISAVERQREALQAELQRAREQLESARRSVDAVATWRRNLLMAASED